jgi:hypothetical protein
MMLMMMMMMMMMMVTTNSCVSVCLSVRVPVRLHGRSGTDFYEICYFGIFPKSVAKNQVGLNVTRIVDDLHEHLCTFVIVSRPIPLRMRNVSDKGFEENQNPFYVE